MVESQLIKEKEINHKHLNIVIAGGDGSIGLAIHNSLRDHYNVISIDKKNNSGINILCDLTNSTEVKKTFETINSTFEKIDCLILAQGRVLFKPLFKSTANDALELLHANYLSTINCLQGSESLLLKSEAPLLININSNSEIDSFANNALYSASKVASSKILDVLAVENPKIKITRVYLGAVKSNFWNSYPEFNLEDMLDPTLVAKTVEFILQNKSHVHIPSVTLMPKGGVL